MTLLEIIVAMLILSLVMYGLVSIFAVSKRFVYHSGSRVISMELGKYFYEDANLTVSADFYPSGNCLYNDSECEETNRTYNGILYNISYLTDNVTKPSGGNTTLRKVMINVSWVEPK